MGLFDRIPIAENDKLILSEFSNDYPTHILYKFLVKSKLIDSIKHIELGFNQVIDSELLFKLISEYKSKISQEFTFCVSHKPTLSAEVYLDIYDLYLKQIEKYPSLNYK